jgi:hypothetical protein
MRRSSQSVRRALGLTLRTNHGSMTPVIPAHQVPSLVAAMGDRRQRRRRRLIRSVRRDSPRDRSTEMCERDLVHHTPECIGLVFFCAVRNAKQATGTQCNSLSHVAPYWYHLQNTAGFM